MNKKCTLEEATQKSVAFVKAKVNWEIERGKVLASLETVRTTEENQCWAGNGASCNKAGVHYFYLASVRNPAKAKALYEEGCRLSDKESCQALELIKKGIVKVFDVEI